MKLTELDISGAWFIEPLRHTDDRGWFQEWFKQSEFEQQVEFNFAPVQANISHSSLGTIRGIHYSVAPLGQAKLVTVLSGEIDDYVIDIRRNSPTFGQWERVRLTADNSCSVLLSPHLGHAFHALADNTVVTYLVSAEYNPSVELGINPFCPHIAIDWAKTGEHGISPKDTTAPDLITQRDAGKLPFFL